MAHITSGRFKKGSLPCLRRLSVTIIFLILQAVITWVIPATAQSLSSLQTAWSALPAPIAFYPLSGKFGLNDISGNGIDGYYSSTDVTLATGPFGVANTSYETGNTADLKYMNFTSPSFRFGSKSWSMSVFVNLKNNTGQAPLLEYTNYSSAFYPVLWQYPSTAAFFIYANNNTCIRTTNCTMSPWQYVGWIYDNSTTTLSSYCNGTRAYCNMTTGPPWTTSTFMAGFRNTVGGAFGASSLFSCLAVYGYALTNTQLQQVQQLCQMIQALPCTNCPQKACRMNLTATLGYQCSSCNVGWTGPDCSIFSTVNALKGAWDALPAPVAYYPLSSKFGLSDISGNSIDGYYSSTAVTLATGPFGVANTAYETGDLISDNKYMNFTSPLFSFGAKSWTMSLFVNLKNNSGWAPILEYSSIDSNFSSHIWQYPSSNTLYANSVVGPLIYDSCVMSPWQYIAWQYDNSTNNFSTYCNGTRFYSNTAGPPRAASTFLAGFRNTVGGNYAANTMFSCLAVYPATLSDTQLQQVRQLCQMIDQAIVCTNCIAATCRMNLSSTLGWKCSNCNPGSTGLDCSTYICSPACSSQGNCTGPNICSCRSGWTGTSCSTAICSPACSSNGSCISPNVCLCDSGWTGPTCSSPVSPLNALKSAWSASPAPVAYYPLSGKFGLNDIGGNNIDGNYSATAVTLATGPFGVANTAYETGALVNDNKYVTFASPVFNFGAKSWTMSLFVNLKNNTGWAPILEYTSYSSNSFSHLWQYPATNMLYAQSVVASLCVNQSCVLSPWQYIAWQYDNGTNNFSTYCNGSRLTRNTAGPPLVASALLAGFRNTVGQQNYAANTMFSCLAVYSATLSDTQLQQVRQLCQMIDQAILCTNCAPTSCRMNLNATLGWQCSNCNAGWTGQDCSAYTCSPACSSHSNCTGPNTCNCDVGWTGPTCLSGICSSPCQHNGSCTAPETCSCASGWTGTTCATALCSPSCLNGVCSAPNICTCSTGWTGPTCSTPICSSGCGNGGNCTSPNTCSCHTGWTGSSCNTPICSNLCTNGGTCILPNTCSCAFGWTGLTCASAICSMTCSPQGSCTAPNTCSCSTGWAGATCNTPICSSGCANGGNCTSPNTCSCPTGWTGSSCNAPICSNICSNGGTCVLPNTCSCTSGWTGSTCASAICSMTCSPQGSCIAPNTCACLSGWTGATCNTPVCSPSCNNGGTCIAPNSCFCPMGWTGISCSTAICSPNCTNGGLCVVPNSCSCLTGWSGSICDTPVCSAPCQNGGSCVSPDTCSCKVGWTDKACTTAICSSPCQNGGTCLAPDVCACSQGWTGISCSNAFCSPPCQNNATCVAADVCSCLPYWTGSHCENAIMTASELEVMSDDDLIQNFTDVTSSIAYISASTAASRDTDNIVNILSTIDTLVDRYGNLTVGAQLSQRNFQLLTKVCSSAADSMMYSMTNFSESQSAIQLVETTIKCEIQDGQAVGSKAAPALQETTKQQLQKMFDAFMKTIVNMFARLRTILPPGANMTFAGDFYGAVVFNLKFGDLPGLKLQTNLADVTFPSGHSASKIIQSLPAGCSELFPNSMVLIVLSSFIVNVNDANKPFNMPTVAVRLYCQEQLELTLNPDLPILIVAIPSVQKAQLFASQKKDAQCDVSQITCTLATVSTIGVLASFPLVLTAGDFVLIFPAIPLAFSTYVAVNFEPTKTQNHWQFNLTASNVSFWQNTTLQGYPRYFYNVGVDFRIIIPSNTLNVLALKKSLPTISVYMKKDLSSFNKAATLPLSVCDLQRCYGYHLGIGLASNASTLHKESQLSRKRRNADETNSDDNGFELQPQSNESAVVFKSSYFGDYGADLIISPNTIEFSNIFTNFSKLVADNWAVLAFQVVAVVIFVVALVFAFYFDKKDLENWAFLPIVDNQPHQKMQYLVSVHHSRVKNFKAGPKISIRLIGNVQETNWRLLHDGIRENFNGRHPANFILATQLTVGWIDAIELKIDSHHHSEKGSLFKLHIDRVVVIDVNRGLKFIFVTKSSLNSGDAVRVNNASEDDIKSYSYLISGHSESNITDTHPWLSVVMRPLASNWTRCERLACVVSALFLAMVVNAMFYGKEADAPNVGVNVGNLFTLSWFTVWTSFIGCLIAIPPTAAIALIFKRVKRRSALRSQWTNVFNVQVNANQKQGVSSADDAKQTKSTKKPFELPYPCVFLGWALVAASVGVSSFFVVLYSLEWGRSKSLQWLTGMVMSLGHDILLIQPIKVIVVAILSATLHNLPIDGLELGQVAYNRNNDRRKTELFLRLRVIITGMIHHVIYIVIFAIVIGTTTNRFSYLQTTALRQTVRMPNVTPVTDTITDPSSVYNWMTAILIPSYLNGNQLNGAANFMAGTVPYYIRNPNVALLGPIRLRQQRIASGECLLKSSLGRLRNGKYATLLNPNKCQSSSPQKGVFNGTWLCRMIQPNREQNNFSINAAPWVYRDSDGLSYVGWEAVYSTGGYYVDLPLNKTLALMLIAELSQNNWIDDATTVLFIDFNLFNAQCNLFIAVKVVFESLNTGGISYHFRLFPLQLYQYYGASSILVIIVQLLWFLLLVSHFIKIIQAIRRHGFFKFKSNGWNWLDLCQLMLGFGVVTIFLSRIYYIISSINNIRMMQTSYVSLDLLVSWEDVLFCCFGIQFFLAMTLFFRYLSINKHWAVLLSTLSRGKIDVFTYGTVFGSVTILFAGIAYLVMGLASWNFSNYGRSILTLVQALLGTVDFSTIAFSRFYLFLAMLYNAVVIFVGSYLFVTLILEAHSEIVADVVHRTNWDSELADYMSTSLRNLLTLKKEKFHRQVVRLNFNIDQSKPFQESLANDYDRKEADLCTKLEEIADRLVNLTNRLVDSQEPIKTSRFEILWAFSLTEHFRAIGQSNGPRRSTLVASHLESCPSKERDNETRQYLDIIPTSNGNGNFLSPVTDM